MLTPTLSYSIFHGCCGVVSCSVLLYICLLCIVKHLYKTLSIVRPCAAVLRMEKTCCAWERSRIVVRWRWMSTMWNAVRYGVMFSVVWYSMVCDVVFRIVYVWSCVMVFVYDVIWFVAEFWASIITAQLYTISRNMFIICWRCCCCYCCLLVGLLLEVHWHPPFFFLCLGRWKKSEQFEPFNIHIRLTKWLST